MPVFPIIVFLAKSIDAILAAGCLPHVPCPICGVPIIVCTHSLDAINGQYYEDERDSWYYDYEEHTNFDPEYERALMRLDNDNDTLDQEALEHPETLAGRVSHDHGKAGIHNNASTKHWLKRSTARARRRSVRMDPEAVTCGNYGYGD